MVVFTVDSPLRIATGQKFRRLRSFRKFRTGRGYVLNSGELTGHRQMVSRKPGKDQPPTAAAHQRSPSVTRDKQNPPKRGLIQLWLRREDGIISMRRPHRTFFRTSRGSGYPRRPAIRPVPLLSHRAWWQIRPWPARHRATSVQPFSMPRDAREHPWRR